MKSRSLIIAATAIALHLGTDSSRVRAGELTTCGPSAGDDGRRNFEAVKVNTRETILSSRVDYEEARGNLHIPGRYWVRTEIVLVEVFVEGKLVKRDTRERKSRGFEPH